MIIWINGAFAGGKTTLAGELRRQLPDAMFYDPEYVGYILVRWVPQPESGDFQDIPLWRKMVAEFAVGLAADYGRIREAGQDLLHVFLDVPAAELRRRIDAQVVAEGDPEQDARARAFRHQNVDRCVAARADLPADTLILRGDQHAPAELAALVLAAAERASSGMPAA